MTSLLFPRRAIYEVDMHATENARQMTAAVILGSRMCSLKATEGTGGVDELALVGKFLQLSLD